jgi:hypothetical protein
LVLIEKIVCVTTAMVFEKERCDADVAVLDKKATYSIEM